MIAIDVGRVGNEHELHGLLKTELAFPACYGMNWDTFRDAITGLVEVPDHVRFAGWDHLAERVPRGAGLLRQSLDRYRDELRPDLVVEYL